jgi:hypothetical protein
MRQAGADLSQGLGTHRRRAVATPGQSTRKRRPTGLERCRSPCALDAALLGLGSVGLLLVVAPPGDVIDQIRDMSPAWVLGAIALELGSCVSYVIVFRRFFPEPPPAVSRRIAWIAMGAGAVLPGGNFRPPQPPAGAAQT